MKQSEVKCKSCNEMNTFLWYVFKKTAKEQNFIRMYCLSCTHSSIIIDEKKIGFDDTRNIITIDLPAKRIKNIIDIINETCWVCYEEHEVSKALLDCVLSKAR